MNKRTREKHMSKEIFSCAIQLELYDCNKTVTLVLILLQLRKQLNVIALGCKFYTNMQRLITKKSCC